MLLSLRTVQNIDIYWLLVGLPWKAAFTNIRMLPVRQFWLFRTHLQIVQHNARMRRLPLWALATSFQWLPQKVACLKLTSTQWLVKQEERRSMILNFAKICTHITSISRFHRRKLLWTALCGGKSKAEAIKNRSKTEYSVWKEVFGKILPLKWAMCSQAGKMPREQKPQMPRSSLGTICFLDHGASHEKFITLGQVTIVTFFREAAVLLAYAKIWLCPICRRIFKGTKHYIAGYISPLQFVGSDVHTVLVWWRTSNNTCWRFSGQTI